MKFKHILVIIAIGLGSITILSILVFILEDNTPKDKYYDQLCQSKGHNKSTDVETGAIGNGIECDGKFYYKMVYGESNCPINKWGKRKCGFWTTKPVILEELRDD